MHAAELLQAADAWDAATADYGGALGATTPTGTSTPRLHGRSGDRDRGRYRRTHTALRETDTLLAEVVTADLLERVLARLGPSAAYAGLRVHDRGDQAMPRT